MSSGDFVLLCYTRNTPYSYDAHAPLPILALGTFLELNGVEIEYFDERIQPIKRYHELLDRHPRLVGLSVIGGYQITSASRLSRIARKRSPESRIVWGGISPTTLPELTIAEDFIDFVALGEGEETLLDLYGALGRADGKAAARVLGIFYKEAGGDIRRTPPRPLSDMEALPFVYQGKAAAMLQRYLERASIREAVGYETSRGCPFLCSFCYSPNFHNNTRVKSLEKVRPELAAMRRLGVEDLDIYDDTLFGAKKDKFPVLLDALRQEKMRWIGNLRVNMLTEELVGRLEASGCKWIYFGIESNDDRVLRRIKKGFAAKDITRGIEIMRHSKIPTVYSIIYGYPLTEAQGRVEPYLDFAMEIHRKHPAAEIQIQSFVPLPGSELYADAVNLGFAPPQRLSDWVQHDHFGVNNQWLADPALANKVYISTFLAFRYRRHLSSLPMSLVTFPLHKFSLWRVRNKFFNLYFEGLLYKLFFRASELWTTCRFWLRDRLSCVY